MTINDPVGDMLTRIRNAQMRRKRHGRRRPARSCAPASSTCSSPRATSATTRRPSSATAAPSSTIELKYYDGQPVIRSIAARLEARPARLCVRRHHAARGRRPRHHHPLDAAGRHGRSRGAREERGRRSALQGLLTGRRTEPRETRTMSRVGKKPVAVPSGVTATVDGQTVKMKGPKGELSLRRARRGLGRAGGRRGRGRRRATSPRRPARSGACPARRWRTSSRASPRASRSGSRSTASATRPRSPARC